MIRIKRFRSASQNADADFLPLLFGALTTRTVEEIA